jgi:acetyl esterase
MPLLPALKPMFDAQRSSSPDTTGMSPAEVREMMHAMIDQSFLALSNAQDTVASERDITIPVSDGAITVRIYRAEQGDETSPCHIYFHGGGFFLGTLSQADNLCRMYARELACTVVSIDYRLAPEHRFPTAAEDAYAALNWVFDHASELKIDRARLSVGGGSAGGNLAAAVSIMARDRGGPALVAQILEIPVLDFTSSRTLDFPDEGIHIGSDKGYATIYLRDGDDARNPLASPLLAPSLEGLPPALVMCAEYDQLQPEGEAYARRLAEAGVPATYHCWAGQFHGSQGFDKLIPEETAAYSAEIFRFLREAYRRVSA